MVSHSVSTFEKKNPPRLSHPILQAHAISRPMNPQLKQPKIRPGLPEPRAPADRPFNAIRSYLEDQATLAQAVDRLADPIASYHEREFDDLVDQSLYFTWETFNDIMVQIPPENAAWHTKLAEILIGLSERRSPSQEVRTVGEALNNVLWADLPYYAPEFLHGWVDAASTAHAQLEHDRRLDPDFAPDYDSLREGWTRSNAFVARLVTKQYKALDYEVYAVHAMRAALEEELHADELWMNVPGAVVWIFYAGDFIFNSQREWGPAPEGGEPGNQGVAHGGSLWLGKTALCKERWRFWKERSIRSWKETMLMRTLDLGPREQRGGWRRFSLLLDSKH